MPGDIRDEGLIPGSGRSPGEGHSNPLQYSSLENPMDRGAWWAAVHGVAKSRTRLKWLSSHLCLSHSQTQVDMVYMILWEKLKKYIYTYFISLNNIKQIFNEIFQIRTFLTNMAMFCANLYMLWINLNYIMIKDKPFKHKWMNDINVYFTKEKYKWLVNFL